MVRCSLWRWQSPSARFCGDARAASNPLHSREFLRRSAPTSFRLKNSALKPFRIPHVRYRMTRFFQEACMPRISRASARLGRFLTASVFAALLFAPLLLAQSAAAQAQTGKELTVERLFRAPFLGGRQTQGIEWAPDGKRFSYLDRQGYGKDAVLQLWTMDAATGERKVLVNAETLKSVMQPEKAKTSQATGLGRVQADNYLWSPDGNSLLFIGSNSLVLLDLKTMTPKPVLSSKAEIEDPKFSPDGHRISFSRRANLFA